MNIKNRIIARYTAIIVMNKYDEVSVSIANEKFVPSPIRREAVLYGAEYSPLEA